MPGEVSGEIARKLAAEREKNKELEAAALKSTERGVNGNLNHQSGIRNLTEEDCLGFWEHYITSRRLQNFYKCRLGHLGLDYNDQFQKHLQNLLQKDAEQAVFITKEIPGIEHEFALDLSVLSLYDIAVLIDDSGSMTSGDRKERLKRVLKLITEFMGFVSNKKRGILTVRFLNGGDTGNRIKTAKEVDDLIDKHEFGGETHLAQALNRKILAEFVYKLKPGTGKVQIEKFRRMKRPLLIVIITDGDVDKKKQEQLKTLIENSVKWLDRAPKGPGNRAVVFQFAGVGSDKGAEEFFRKLDDQTEPVDIADVVDYQAGYLEQQGTEDINLKDVLKGEEWHARMKMAKLVLGPLLKRFDEHESDDPRPDDEFESDFTLDEIPVDDEESYSSDYGDDSDGE